MRNTIEVTTEVCVNNFLMASIDQLVDSIHRVQRAAVSPIGVLFRLQICLEDGFEKRQEPLKRMKTSTTEEKAAF